jgi:SAM-dependent methyltransferase
MPDFIDYSRVADLYDSYVRTTLDIPFFLKEAQKVPGDVLELMSGTGRISLPLVESGVQLTCVDRSPELLAILKGKLLDRGLTADVIETDVRTLVIDKHFDLVLLASQSFDELLTTEGQRAVLTSVHDLLSPHGRFICTLHNPYIRLRRTDGRFRLQGKYSRDDGSTLLVWTVSNYDSISRLVVGIELYDEFDTRGLLKSRRLLEVQYSVPGRSEFERMAKSAGFKIAALYGGYSYAEFVEEESPYQVWVLKK